MAAPSLFKTDALGRLAWDERVTTVRTWPGLRGEAKLAWHYLYYVRERVGGTAIGRPGTVRFTCADLGADQGTSDAAGKRAFESLERCGLLVWIGKPPPERRGDRQEVRSSLRTCYLPDPLDAAIGRRVAPDGHGQGELFETQEEPEELADEPQQSVEGPWQKTPARDRPVGVPGNGSVTEAPALPSRRPGSPATEAPPDPLLKCAKPGKNHDPPTEAPPDPSLPRPLNTYLDTEEAQSSETLHCSLAPSMSLRAVLGAREAATEAPPDPSQIGGLVAQLLAGGRLPTPAQQVSWVAELVAWIKAEVADPKLTDETPLQVAQAIVSGDYPAKELVGVLRSLNKAASQGTLQHERWMYFVGTVRKSMRRHDSRTR